MWTGWGSHAPFLVCGLHGLGLRSALSLNSGSRRSGQGEIGRGGRAGQATHSLKIGRPAWGVIDTEGEDGRHPIVGVEDE